MSDREVQAKPDQFQRQMRLFGFLAEHSQWHTARSIMTSVLGYLDPEVSAAVRGSGAIPKDLRVTYDSARRMLDRDMQELGHLGMDIGKRAGTPDDDGNDTAEYGITGRSFASEFVELTFGQMLALDAAAALARNAPDSGLSDYALAAIEKITRPGDVVPELPVSVSLQVPSNEPDAAAANIRLAKLATIMGRRHAAQFTYTKPDGTSSKRQIEVYGLGERVGLWYAIGRDIGDGTVKAFRLSRIGRDLQECTKHAGPNYTVPEGFDLSEYVRQPWFIGDDREVVKLAFASDIAHIAHAHLQHVPLKRRDDGWYVGEFEVTNSNNLLRWVLTFGPHAEVLAPPHVRHRARRMLEEVASHHG